MDFGIGELPAARGENHVNDTAVARDKQDVYIRGSVASTKDMDLQPPPGTLPYLVPKANVSRESLHSLSDPRDDPYGAIYSSTPPSPGGAFSPFSDQHSIRSSRNLLPPTSHLEELSPNLTFKPSSRVPSPLAFSDHPQQTSESTPSKVPAGSFPGVSEHNRTVSPSKSPSRSPLRERAVTHEELHEPEPIPFPKKLASPGFADYEQNDVTQQLDHTVFDLGIPAPMYNVARTSVSSPANVGQRTATREELETTQFPGNGMQEYEVVGTQVWEGDRNVELTEDSSHNHIAKQVDHDVSHVHGEEDEDQAKRIQSVYKEYYNNNEAHYYDGSEEWESLPQRNYHELHTQSRPPMPSNYNRPEWHDSAEQYDEYQNWHQANNQGYYQGEPYDHPHYVHNPVGLGMNSQWQLPPSRPSYHSRPSTSYSTSSLPSRARTPTRPLEPLTDLPSTRDKLDDLASPISFSKPRRFAGTGGRDSPINRPASPAQVLSSSRSHLPELPVPHRLRRSGSFSSIEFAPIRKYAPSEVDIGDTASIRSLARTEASLMAVSAGSGRIDRLPQDLVPVGKGGAMASLRPQNYDGSRYI